MRTPNLAIIERVRDRLRERLHVEDVFRHGVCLYASHILCEELHAAGQVPMLQAGTALWKFRESETGHTHVGFEWDSRSGRVRIPGALPEIHVWVYVRNTETLIDLMLPHFERLVPEIGFVQEIPFPEYFWDTPNNLPDHTVYRPEVEPTFLAIGLLQREFGQLLYLPPQMQKTQK